MLHRGSLHHTLDNHNLPILPSYWQRNRFKMAEDFGDVKSSPSPDIMPTPTPMDSLRNNYIIHSEGEDQTHSNVINYQNLAPTYQRSATFPQMWYNGEDDGQKPPNYRDSQPQARRNGSDVNRLYQANQYNSSSTLPPAIGAFPPISGRSRRRANAISVSSQLDFPTPYQSTTRHPYASISNSSTRRLSASFTTDGPLTSDPTTAYSSVTASNTRCNSQATPGTPLAHTRRSTNLPLPPTYYPEGRRPSISPQLLKAPSTTTYSTETELPRAQRENTPPAASRSNLSSAQQSGLDSATAQLLPKVAAGSNTKQKAKAWPGIPKSRTFTVFANITNSLSRSSLASFARNESRYPSITSTTTTFPVSPASVMDSENRVQASAPPSPSSPLPSPSPSSVPHPSTTDPQKIYTAESSSYWTGRFVSLHDKFRSEMLLPENLAIVVSAHHGEEQKKPQASSRHFPSSTTKVTVGGRGLPPSGTTGCIPSVPPTMHRRRQQLSRDEDVLVMMMHDETARSRRAFQHLEALCATPEARASLHAWQQAYARRINCEALLPKGGSMENRDHDRDRDRGWVGRLLGSSSVGGGIGSGTGAGKRLAPASIGNGGASRVGIGSRRGPQGYDRKRGSLAL